VRDLLLTLARALVEQPDQVDVTEHLEDGGTLLELKVAPGDLGRVIGKKGRTADALRAVLDAVARRRGIYCDVEIVD
jgi:predicted RNA-binding protein YlqC (UPF0109 family)